MSILVLPTEILELILDIAVQCTELQNATKYRGTCRLFDELVEKIIFRLPKTVLLNRKMGQSMVHKLIQSKMLLGNADELLLCYTINRTADYLVDCDKSRPRNQYTRVLETCAAKTMMYWRLVECVTTEKRRQIGDEDIRENALIAAIGANEMHIVQELLSNGVNPASNTPFFGEPLATAASLGSLALVQLLIDHWDWQRDDYLVDLRLMRAVEAAATAKHNMVLAKLLEYKDRINKSIYDDAIVRMVKRNQEATAELLLDLRQEDPEFDDEWFWVRLVRSAAEHGCRALLQRIMTRALSILSEEWINKALEDACSENHSEIVPIILSRLSVRKPINHAGSLFWAAWFGNLEVLGLLLDFLENDQHALRLALAGAVSRKRPEVVLHLLKLAGVSITDQDPPMRFTDIIRLMNPDAFSQVESRLISTDSVYFPAEQPLEVPVKAQLVDVVGIFNTMGPQDPNDNSERFLELFHRAMVSNALDSLSFLCENLTSTLATRYYKSSAVVQILIDFGRDISYARSSSRNMDLLYDEHFSRWMLDKGACTDARGCMDMDLTVNAVRRAPISTVRLFLDRSNLTNRVHECLLCYAVIRAKDRLEAIELLLNLGCLIDSFWSEGFRFLTSRNRPTLTGTALLHAVTLEHEEEVTYLLSKGADATIKSSDGRTVLEVAEAHGNIKVVRLIQSSLRSQ